MYSLCHLADMLEPLFRILLLRVTFGQQINKKAWGYNVTGRQCNRGDNNQGIHYNGDNYQQQRYMFDDSVTITSLGLYLKYKMRQF